MKKIAKYSLIVLVASTLGFVSCTPERLMDWEGGKNIYFTHLRIPGTQMRAQDTVDLRLFFMPLAVDEILVPLSVTTTGVLTHEDREIRFSVSSFLLEDGEIIATPFVEGTHFEIERPAVIRAGRVEDTLRIRVFRSPELSGAGIDGRIGITLESNQNFGTEIRETRDALNLPPHTLLTRWINVSNRIVRPQWWADASLGQAANFFGPFSPEKFEVIGRANPDMPLAFLDGAEWYGEVIRNAQTATPWWLVIGRNTQEWLDNWHSDPNNPEFTEINAEGVEVRMSMGPRITDED